MDDNDGTTCPYCGCLLIRAYVNGSEALVCVGCGRVFEEDLLSTESEQRFFDPEELYNQSRLVKSMQDHPSLANSQPYSGSNVTEDYRSRRILEIRSVVQSFVNRLKLHPEVEKKAISLLLDFNQKRNLKQKDLEAYVLVSMYVSSRLLSRPIPLDSILKLTNVSKRDFSKALRVFTTVLKIKLPPARPSDFVQYIAESLNLSYYCVRIAEEVAKTIEQRTVLSGRDPLSIAAACTYIATEYTGETRSQKDFARVVHCTEVTLRNRIKEVFEALGGRREINKIVESIYYGSVKEKIYA